MSGAGFVAALLLSAALGGYLQRWATRKLVSADDDRLRRAGWRYGYGAGWVDHRHDVYDPEPPPDGTARSSFRRRT